MRLVRQQLGLSVRDVFVASKKIADQQNSNAEFIISPGRLSEIETRGVVPSIYKLYSLCTIYGVDWTEVFPWFGIDT